MKIVIARAILIFFSAQNVQYGDLSNNELNCKIVLSNAFMFRISIKSRWSVLSIPRHKPLYTAVYARGFPLLNDVERSISGYEGK